MSSVLRLLRMAGLMGRTVGLTVVILLTTWFAIVDGPLSPARWPYELLARLLFAVEAACLVVWIIKRLPVDNTGALSPGPPTPERFSDTDMDKAIRADIHAVAHRYEWATILTFNLLLLRTATSLRLYERAELADQSIVLHTAVDYDLDLAPDDKPEVTPSRVIPVTVVSKGKLLDSLRVTGANGQIVPILSQSDGRGLATYALMSYFAKAFDCDENDLMEAFPATISSKPEQAAFARIVRLIWLPGRVSPKAARDNFDRAVDDLTTYDQSLLESLRGLAVFLAGNYIIAASLPVPPDGQVHIRHRQTIPMYRLTATRLGKLRAAVGMEPHRFTIPIAGIFHAKSYHFKMRGRTGQYVSKHYIVDLDADALVKQSDMASVAPHHYFRIRHQRALPYARAYARGFDTVPDDKIRRWAHIVEFCEVPPGALSSSAAIAMAAAALATTFVFVRPTQGDFGAAALLLAVPAAVAGWAGHSVERVRRSSLASYFGLMVTEIVSVLSTLLYVVERRWSTGVSKAVTATRPKIVGFVTLPSIDLAWLALSVIAVSTVSYLTVLRTQRTRRYLKMVDSWKP